MERGAKTRKTGREWFETKQEHQSLADLAESGCLFFLRGIKGSPMPLPQSSYLVPRIEQLDFPLLVEDGKALPLGPLAIYKENTQAV